MHPIAAALASVTIGPEARCGDLSLFPLIANHPRAPDYLTLDEALALGYTCVTEVSDAGAVPELNVLNGGERPVLILDGEELIGAKQNRVVNLSMLISARSTTTIPVSCVESGRWRFLSRAFESGGRVQHASGRARKMAQVTSSLASTGARHADQSAVWADLDGLAARLGAPSVTHAMEAIFEKYSAELDTFVRAFAPAERQVGCVVAFDGQDEGVELFDAPDTFRKLAPKLIRGYALDAIDRRVRRRRRSAVAQAVSSPAALLATLADTPTARFGAVGLGDDVRLMSGELAGGALVVDDRVVHLAAFRALEHRPAPDWAERVTD